MLEDQARPSPVHCEVDEGATDAVQQLVVVVVEQKKHGFEHSSLPNGRAETNIQKQSAKHSQGEKYLIFSLYIAPGPERTTRSEI